jgi:uncharacterized membrane protein
MLLGLWKYRGGSFVGERLLALGILVVVVGIPAGITWSKGQRAAFVLDFLLFGMIWLVAACRLARPSSWWARRFYGPEKMQRAVNRFDSGTSTA